MAIKPILKLTPAVLKEVNTYLTTPKKVRKFGFDDTTVKTGEDIERPQEALDREMFKDAEERFNKADGGRIGFADGLPKNIRLTPEGRYRFVTDAGGGFSKNFPKGTKLEEVVKFRDKKLKEFGIEKGKNRPVNPDRGEYKSVKGQKHIKFNGVTYQVNIQRGDQGSFYTSDLNKAIKKRDELVKKFPPKTMTDYNVKERPKKINAEILKLSKNSTIKNIFKTGVLTKDAITEATNILNVDRATAIDRLENLASAFAGDRKNVPGIKPTNIDNARKIASLLPGAKTKAAELATGVPFTGESIQVPKKEIGRKAPYDTSIFDIDEARATTTGLKRGTSPYSIFGQVIDQNVNRIVKGGFAGAGWDSRAGTLEAKLDDAIQKFGPNSTQAKAAKFKYNREAAEFESKINKGKLRGTKPIRIPRISLDAPNKTIARYNSFNKKYQSIFDNNFKTKKYSFVIPKDLRTIPELRDDILNPKSVTYKNIINTLKKGFNEFDEKKLFEKIRNRTPEQLQKILRKIPRIASVDNFTGPGGFPLTASFDPNIGIKSIEEDTFARRNPITTGAGLSAAGTAAVLKATGTPIRTALGKAFRGAGTRLGVLPFAAMQVKSNIDKGENIADAVVDPLVGLELSLPGVLKENLSKITTNPTAQRILNLGRFARLTTPVGLGITAAGLGIDAAKAIRARKKQLDALTPDQKTELFRKERQQAVMQNLRGGRNAFDEFSAADGGMAGLSGGKKSGPAPISGPTPHGDEGLPAAFKRVKKQ